MKKLTLNLETLKVESFAVEPSRAARGTVVAAEASGTLPLCCVTFTCGDSHYRPCQLD